MNKTNLQKLIESIKGKNIISIVYDNGREDFFQRIHPYNIFKYRDNHYLIALNENNRGTVTTYKLNKIKMVEITSLYYTEERRGAESIDYNFFNAKNVDIIRIGKHTKTQEIISIIDSDHITGDSTYTKAQRLIEYYIKCLKNESLLEIKIDPSDSKDYFLIDGIKVAQLTRSPYYDIEMDRKIQYVFSNWDRKIKYQPDLDLYLGYPYFEIKGSYIPLAYYKVLYNSDMNTLKVLSGNIGINGAFLNDDMDLSNEQTLEIIENVRGILKGQEKDHYTIDLLNSYFSNLILRYPLIDSGILFMETNIGATRRLIQDLKSYLNLDEKKFTKPFKNFIEAKDLSSGFNIQEKVYNVVEINDSQRIVIEKSERDMLLVQGPPGTGKTQTIINIIANEVIRGNKVLIASVNNKAVDNILDKMKINGIFDGILRLGNREYRAKAAREASRTLQNQYVSTSIDKINRLMEISVQLKCNIDEKNRILDEIKNLEEREFNLEKACDTELAEIQSREIDYEETKSLLKDSIIESKDRCLRVIGYLQYISFWCRKLEERRNIWLWRILCKLGFDYDRYVIKKIHKKLDRIGIDVNRLSKHYLFIEELNQNINNIISVIQYYVTNTELNDTRNLLRKLDKEGTATELHVLNDKKIKNDIELLSAVHTNMMASVAHNKKDATIGYLGARGERAFNSDKSEYETMLEYFPVIATTSLSVSESVPKDFTFDIAIIDEASQCNIPSSIPIINIAKRVIIVGDDKQLNPVISMDPTDNEEYLGQYNLSKEGSIYSFVHNSIFDVFNRFIDANYRLLLEEHYRCHPEVIGFSNKEFYNNRLRIMTEYKKGQFYGAKAINIKGNIDYRLWGAKSADNPMEADAIFDYIVNNYDAIKGKSLGIITPFRKQKELLEKKLNDLKFMSVRDGMHKFLDDITVGTVHTFQGDEKNIIFFSPVIANGVRPGTIKWVNENATLINVAITRAIDNFIVFGDIDFLKESEGLLEQLISYIENLNQYTETLQLKNVFGVYKIISEQEYPKMLDNPNVRSVLNRGELSIYNILRKHITSKYPNIDLGIKVRIIDIINTDRIRLDKREFDYSLKAHFDFVIFDRDYGSVPIFALEYDGRYHREDPKTIKNDALKDKICKIYNFPIERISSSVRMDHHQIEHILCKYLGKKN